MSKHDSIRSHRTAAALEAATAEVAAALAACTAARPNAPATAGTPAHAYANLARRRLSLVKGEHRWRFRWERGGEAALISALAELARDANANFDWFDAAVVCRHIAQALPAQELPGDAHSAQAPSTPREK